MQTRRQFLIGSASVATVAMALPALAPLTRTVFVQGAEHEIRNGSVEFSRLIYKMMYEFPGKEDRIALVGPQALQIINEVIEGNAHPEGGEAHNATRN